MYIDIYIYIYIHTCIYIYMYIDIYIYYMYYDVISGRIPCHSTPGATSSPTGWSCTQTTRSYRDF